MGRAWISLSFQLHFLPSGLVHWKPASILSAKHSFATTSLFPLKSTIGRGAATEKKHIKFPVNESIGPWKFTLRAGESLPWAQGSCTESKGNGIWKWHTSKCLVLNSFCIVATENQIWLTADFRTGVQLILLREVLNSQNTQLQVAFIDLQLSVVESFHSAAFECAFQGKNTLICWTKSDDTCQ